MELGKRELDAALLEAIHAGDAKAVKQLSYETQRRLAKRKAKREGQPLIKPTFQQIKSGIIGEARLDWRLVQRWHPCVCKAVCARSAWPHDTPRA